MVSGYDEVEKKAKAFYAQIGSVPCPKFGGEPVVFNRIGFRHIARKRGMRRPKSEQRRRFALLRYALDMILNLHASVIPKTEGRVKFWMFREERGGRAVKMIVRQLRGGKKHFYSIFSSKKKPPPD